MKSWTVLLLVCCALCAAQESERNVEESGYHTKYLTPNQMDIWKIELSEKETLVAHVGTEEFDPVLELATRDGKVLLEVDDDGSESRFAVRVPKTDEYHVRVHAYKFHGGGNYRLQIRHFAATPITVGEKAVATFAADGKSYHYLQAREGQILVLDIAAGVQRWEILGPKGEKLGDTWNDTFVAQAGDYYLVLDGMAGSACSLMIREARIRDFVEDVSAGLDSGDMDVWNLSATRGQFCEIEVKRTGFLSSRLIYAPVVKEKPDKAWQEIRFFPVASKGEITRFTVLFGRSGRYQLQILARAPAGYRLKVEDTSKPLAINRSHQGQIAVGGSAFYTFEALPGQVFRVRLDAEGFDPFLRLYNSRGNMLMDNDDGGANLASEIEVMVREAGTYRIQVSSLGNGGGGLFSIEANQKSIPQLQVGQREHGTLGANGCAYWCFQGKKGKTVFVSVRAAALDPYVRLYSPAGIILGDDDDGGIGKESLLPITLPEDGCYILYIENRKGQGEYLVRLIDGD